MAESNADTADPRVKYDLVSTISPFLDLHMMFPLIQHLQGKDIYREKDLTFVLLDFLRATNMLDYTLETIETLDPSEIDQEEKEQLSERRDDAVKELEDLEAACGPLLEILRKEEELQGLISEGKFNPQHLAENYNIGEDTIEAFYRYGKFIYEIGSYQDTILVMFYYRELAPESPNAFFALWGKLASELLMLKTTDNVVNALKDVLALQKVLDEREENPLSPLHHLEQLQYRSWLLHWSLFLFFKFPIEEPDEESDGAAQGGEYPNAAGMSSYLLGQMIEFFFSRRNIDAVQTNCPWLMRYLIAAVVISHRRYRKYKNKLTTVVQQEHYSYSDPLTQFVDCLYIDFNFDRAQECLKECEVVMANDFFLEHLVEEFKESARLAIFETFCRIHTKIDTKMLSDKVDLGDQDAEGWLVNLIQGAKLDAKIDSEQDCVVMNLQHPEIYQQIIDRTKDLAYRTYQLSNEVQAMYQKAEQQS